MQTFNAVRGVAAGRGAHQAGEGAVRRLMMMGVAFFAVLGMATMLASAAHAVTAPEYGQCRELTASSKPKAGKGKYEEENCQKLFEVKGKPKAKGNFEWYGGAPANCIAQKKGKYKDSACTILDEKTGVPKGKYERQSCWPNCDKYTGESGPDDEMFLIPVNGSGLTFSGGLACYAGTPQYDITGPKTGEYTGMFADCHNEETGKSCKGIGAAPGEIATTPLHTQLGDLVNSGFAPEFVEFMAKNEDEIDVEYSCEGSGYFEVTGPLNEGGTDQHGGGLNEMSTHGELFLEGKVTVRYYETESKFDNKEVTFTINNVPPEILSAITGAPVEIKY